MVTVHMTAVLPGDVQQVWTVVPGVGDYSWRSDLSRTCLLYTSIAGHWAQDYINEAANAGIVDGYPDGTFQPQQLITRAEAMTMVNRTIDRHPDADHLLEDMITWPDNLETAWYYEQVQEATNSHEYTMNTDDEQNPYEIWTELLPNRDWSELEKAW